MGERIAAAEKRIAGFVEVLPGQLTGIRQEAQVLFHRELAALQQSVTGEVQRLRKDMESSAGAIRQEFAFQREELVTASGEETAGLKTEFQAIQFKLADMATEIELARLLLYKACWLCEQHRPFSKESAMAKMFCSEMYHRVANQAVQIHGGYGLMKEYAVERHYRNQKLLDIGEGTSEVQRIVIARHIGVPGRAL